MSYYSKHREEVIEKIKAFYHANRAEKLAYQKEYDKKRRATGWVPKNYPRKSRRKPRPDNGATLIPIPNEPLPLTQTPRPPKKQKKPPPPPFVWKEASFSMTLN